MKKKLLGLLIFLSLLSCQSDKKAKQASTDVWTPLWHDQHLADWHPYSGAPYKIEEDRLGNAIEPFGIDNDPP